MARFDMGQATLGTLRRQTGGSNRDLAALVKGLIIAAEPLEGRFNGAGKAAFDAFKAHADQVSADLGGALFSVLRGQTGMDVAFVHGEQEMVDSTRCAQGVANFDAARFGGR